MPSTATSLIREVCPRSSVTADFRTPHNSATKSTSASLACPSTGRAGHADPHVIRTDVHHRHLGARGRLHRQRDPRFGRRPPLDVPSHAPSLTAHRRRNLTPDRTGPPARAGSGRGGLRRHRAEQTAASDRSDLGSVHAGRRVHAEGVPLSIALLRTPVAPLTLSGRPDVFCARSGSSATTDGIGAHVLLRRG